MSWHIEHPNSLNDIPRSFLDLFEDISWHNDAMPRFKIFGSDYLFDEIGIDLWIDYSTEENNPNRFTVAYNSDLSVHGMEYSTGNLKDLTRYLVNDLDSLRIRCIISAIDYYLPNINCNIASNTKPTSYEGQGLKWIITEFRKQEIETFKTDLIDIELDYLQMESMVHVSTVLDQIRERMLEIAVVVARETFDTSPNRGRYIIYRDAIKEFAGDAAPTMLKQLASPSADLYDYMSEDPSLGYIIRPSGHNV